MILEYFTQGTQSTRTGGSIGIEVETDFVADDGRPISAEIATRILGESVGRPSGCRHQLELGRQKIEVSVGPQSTPHQAIEAAHESLRWLYAVAARHGARPVFAPEFKWQGELLYVQEERDELWVALDGRNALEHLCRCSSVQFTIAVSPGDAIPILNRLSRSGLHRHDYAPNDRLWKAYIAQSRARYRPDRYGGPGEYDDFADYVAELERHEVLMHQGRPVHLPVTQVPDLNIDLFLRSVWWHYRLRRYANTLAIEVRPLARRRDEDFDRQWEMVAQAIGL